MKSSGDELCWVASAQHSCPDRRLNELGNRFALAEQRLDFGTQLGLNANRWNGGGLHCSIAAHLRCMNACADSTPEDIADLRQDPVSALLLDHLCFAFGSSG